MDQLQYEIIDSVKTIDTVVVNGKVSIIEKIEVKKTAVDSAQTAKDTVASVPAKSEKMSDLAKNLDPIGVGMAAIGMGVVFLSLILLYILFFWVSKTLNRKLKKKLKKDGTPEAEKAEADIPAEVNAAIAMALHLYLREVHDDEEAVLTIKKVARTYSPWSSKIYGMRQFPR